MRDRSFAAKRDALTGVPLSWVRTAEKKLMERDPHLAPLKARARALHRIHDEQQLLDEAAADRRQRRS